LASDYAAAIEAILSLPNPALLYHVGGPSTTWKKWLQAIASAVGKPLQAREVPLRDLEAGSELFRDYLKYTLTVSSSRLPEIRWTPLSKGAASLVAWMENEKERGK